MGTQYGNYKFDVRGDAELRDFIINYLKSLGAKINAGRNAVGFMYTYSGKYHVIHDRENEYDFFCRHPNVQIPLENIKLILRSSHNAGETNDYQPL